MKGCISVAVLLLCVCAASSRSLQSNWHKISKRSTDDDLITCDRGETMDIAFLLDASKSVGFMNYKKVVAFVQDFINAFNVSSQQVRIGLVYFSVNATTFFEMDDYSEKQAILDKLDEMTVRDFKYELGTRTNTSGGLWMAHKLFASQRNQTDAKMLIVITDGKPNSDKELTIPHADLLKADGVRIMAIGVGDDIQRKNLEDIASEPFDRYVFTIEDFEQLVDDTNRMIKTTCRNVEYLECPIQEANDQIIDAQHQAIEDAIASLLSTQSLLNELEESCVVDPCPSCFARNDTLRSCYRIVHEEVAWAEGDRLCAQLYGARLLSIDTEEEHHHIRNLTRTLNATDSGITRWWTSGNDLANHGTWMWAGDGLPVTQSLPGGGNSHHCVLLDSEENLDMAKAGCGVSHGFICEKNF